MGEIEGENDILGLFVGKLLGFDVGIFVGDSIQVFLTYRLIIRIL